MGGARPPEGARLSAAFTASPPDGGSAERQPGCREGWEPSIKNKTRKAPRRPETSQLCSHCEHRTGAKTNFGGRCWGTCPSLRGSLWGSPRLRHTPLPPFEAGDTPRGVRGGHHLRVAPTGSPGSGSATAPTHLARTAATWRRPPSRRRASAAAPTAAPGSPHAAPQPQVGRATRRRRRRRTKRRRNEGGAQEEPVHRAPLRGGSGRGGEGRAGAARRHPDMADRGRRLGQHLRAGRAEPPPHGALPLLFFFFFFFLF